MPLYEFSCPACGAKFEEIVSSSNTSKVVCEKCGEKNPKRLMSTFATSSDSSSSFSSGGGGGCGPNPSGFS